MANDIIKLQLEERIRILCLKHAGSIELISKEGNVPPEYVQKVIAKIQRKQKRDVSAIVGDSMAGYIMLGSEQRKAWLLEQLQKEAAKQPIEQSVCCSRPIKKHIWNDEEHAVCTKCEKDCEIDTYDPRDKKVIIKLIAELRAEDSALVDFLERLGFVNGGKERGGTTVNNYNVALAAAKLSPEDQKMVVEAGQLDPRTRESLRKDLERRVIDTQFEPKNG
jgi:hypothetical protein